MPSPIRDFIQHHYRHFNAASLRAAADDYIKYIDAGNKMLVTLAGAMSTAELGISLAEMIRNDKIHAICCTGANLEEDIFNLVAHDHYERVPGYRYLSALDEKALLDRHMNRVTDTCIPEGEAMRRIESAVLKHWVEKDQQGKRLFPHEFMFEILRDGELRVVLRRRAEREDHLGQAGRGHAEPRDRIGRVDRRTADVCLRARTVDRVECGSSTLPHSE